MSAETDEFSGDRMRTVLEAIGTMVAKVYEQTGRHGITAISLTPEVGLSLGISPGASVDVATSVGQVSLLCERAPHAHHGHRYVERWRRGYR